MKTVGLLGGMSWESTQVYYRLLNQGVNRALGKLHSASILLASVDFEPLQRAQHRDDWDTVRRILVPAAQQLEGAGAGCLLLASNTMHRVAPTLQEALGIPLLHVVDAVGAALAQAGIRKVGLLGTAFTMEQPFYRQRLVDHFGQTVITPDADDRAWLHGVIFDELCRGVVSERSKTRLGEVIERLGKAGAEGVILGCTEIGMLVDDGEAALPLFDTTVLHAEHAVAWCLGDP
nr:aspartate/glutamate racemase family protein [Motiliproteus sp. SC1-56]